MYKKCVVMAARTSGVKHLHQRSDVKKRQACEVLPVFQFIYHTCACMYNAYSRCCIIEITTVTSQCHKWKIESQHKARLC